MISTAVTISFWMAVLVATGWLVVVMRVVRSMSVLRRMPTKTAVVPGPLPRVSAIMAVRDEARAIEASLLSLFAQQDVDLDVVVVDDGSTDDTPSILQRLAALEPNRLLVLPQKKLPPGWVAKNYALELGQGRSRGDYLLFTDGDVEHGPRALANAVAVMKAEQLDHLAIQPRLEVNGFWEAVVLPLFVVLCQLRFVDARSGDATARRGVGIGAFNMVAADAYRLRGTHARIRGAMLDDRALGHMMRDDGGRGGLMRALTQVRQRPYRSLRELYAGIRKGVVGTFGNSGVLTLIMGVVLLVSAVLPVVMMAFALAAWTQGYGGWGVVPIAVSLLMPCIALIAARGVIRFEPRAVVFFPVGAVIIAACAMHAGVVFLARGTIEWRGRHYTRKDLANVG
jgi:glycosyltransferase involved in cell wall biosynthesis